MRPLDGAVFFMGRWSAPTMRQDGRLGRPLEWLEPRAPGLHHFLVREDRPFPALREAMAIATFLILLATVLWGATGQTFPTQSPVVVVESESMMHCDPPYLQGGGRNCQRADDVRYGRIGTIDPGDLIFVRDIDGRADVEAWADAVGRCDSRHTDFQDALRCGCDGRDGFGACGDVIIFRKSNVDQTTPVIHRALFWLEVHGNRTYSVDLPEAWGCTDLEYVPLRSSSEDGHSQPDSALDRSTCLNRLGAGSLSTQIDELGPEDSGFITRGDNNGHADQAQNAIEPLPVKPSQILGKARGEVPWLGLVKLFATDLVSPREDYQKAPGDVKVLMWLTLGTIIALPAIFEAVQKLRRRD